MNMSNSINFDTVENEEVNTQDAMLQLLDELNQIAQGDLTVQATVTADITGTIADSINVTVGQVRDLLGDVQTTSSRVVETTQLVEEIATDLLSKSEQQKQEITDTGNLILTMAEQIESVSEQAKGSEEVARKSLAAARTGLDAVRQSIDGMNSIRDHIQGTSKRIKRLGESSQEISEINKWILDITEQVNVLALNASIQAAAAGDAGRGFNVVAEEMQNLAERSADASKQIASLLRSIQTDTQSAVEAMEKSTHEVVEGAKRSDAAGTALLEIDSVSVLLEQLIKNISEETSFEAQNAKKVAEKIKNIFMVSQQTAEGTKATSQTVRDLANVVSALQNSVAKFKIS